MKTKTTLLLFFLMHSAFAQTLFVPGGTAGIGNSNNKNMELIDGSIMVKSEPYSHIGIERSNGARLTMGVTSGSTKGFLSSTGSIKFLTNGNAKMFILENGNVGIGRSPEGRLDIKGEGNAYSFEHFIVRDQYNNKDFVIRGNGTVEIGYDVDVPAGYMLGVGGKAIMEEVVVKLAVNWPDYVFEKNYQLADLRQLESYIKENKHLPGIPTARQIEEEGIRLGEMNAKLLEKVEELTLYLIQQNNTIKAQAKKMECSRLRH